MAKSDFLKDAVLDHCMGKSSFTMPSAVYAALCVDPVGSDDTGSTINEATYSGYARVQVEASDLAAASGGEMTNSADIVWPDVVSGTNTVVAVAFCTASTGGNVLYFDADVGSVEVSVTQSPPTIRAGALTITEE